MNNKKDGSNEEKDEGKGVVEISKNKSIRNMNEGESNNEVDNGKDKGMNEIGRIIGGRRIKRDGKRGIDKK
ncbi:DUF1542 domain-containing protein, partial [Staphylococcus epidermidis]|uniref:DUF1542 domain-containing protein n=1 Tax=Staphylococcus epidermidis TaxID=1282 RepID=UPI0021B48009